jgi:hypothetical protein
LKEINEAYDLLISGKAARRASDHSSTNQAAAQPRESARRFRWQLILLPVLVSAIVFFAAFRALVPSGQQNARTAMETTGQTQNLSDEERSQIDTVSGVSARSRKRDDGRNTLETKPDNSTTLENATPQTRTPLPTVTLTIDPATGLIATPDCPNKSKMTYPSGAEPTQYCNASHAGAEKTSTREDEPRTKTSRFKSFARRLASPAKLLKGKEGSDNE